MDRTQVLALYDQDQRIAVEYPGMRREALPTVVRHVNTSGAGEGSIIYTRLNEANAEAAIREQVSYFERLGQGFEWKLYDHDTPADLKQRLEAHGFAIEEGEAIMVLDLHESPRVLEQPLPPTVRRITDPDQLSDVLAVQREVWKEDFTSLGNYLDESLRNYPEQMSVYVAYVDDEPATAAWIYFPQNSQFASLWGGSTRERFRKQGLYTGLLAARAQEAKARQVRYLTVDASPMSRPILEKFGFEMITFSYPCKWKVKSSTAAEQQVDQD
jgi:GNAT superfamily N-acetyltransferase